MYRLKIWKSITDSLTTWKQEMLAHLKREKKYWFSPNSSQRFKWWSYKDLGRGFESLCGHFSPGEQITCYWPDLTLPFSGTWRLCHIFGHVLQVFLNLVTHISFLCTVSSRNGKYVLSSGKDSLVKLWELSTSRCLIAYTGAGSTGKQVN